MVDRSGAALLAAILAWPGAAAAVSDGNFDVGRQGCEPGDYSYDRKDVDHSGDGCETITVQAGPAGDDDFVRAGLEHTPEGTAPHSGSVKVGRAGENAADDSNRIAVVHADSGYAATGPRTLTPEEAEDPSIEPAGEPGVSPAVQPENATGIPTERPLEWSHYFGMDDNWIFGEHHATRQPGYEDLHTGPVSGGGWSVATHPDLENPGENVDPTDRRRPVRAVDAVMGFCNDGLCMSVTTEERTIYRGGDEEAERRPAWDHSGNPPNGRSEPCDFRDPDGDCQEFHDNQGEVYVPWGVNFYQDPHPAAPDRFGPELWDYPMPSTHVGSEGVRVADEEIVRLARGGAPLNLGHRGTGVNRAGNPYPENTIVSFLRAMDEGADGVELDVELARDNDDGDPFNELVVLHDESLSITTTCAGAPLDRSTCVSERTVDDIQASCIPINGNCSDGVCNTAEDEGLPPQVVPTLEAALTAIFDAYPGAIVNVEIKSQPPTDATSAQQLCSSADPEHRSTILTLELIGEKFADEKPQIILSSFDPTAVALAKMTDPSLDVGYLSVPANQVPPPFPAAPTAAHGAVLAAGLGLDSLHSSFRDTDLAVVTLAHELGLTVRPWTVNDPCEMQRLIDLGVEALITDEPDLLVDEIENPTVCD